MKDGVLFNLHLQISSTWKKIEKNKRLENLSVKPSIFDGLKTSRHVVSHKPSELSFLF